MLKVCIDLKKLLYKLRGEKSMNCCYTGATSVLGVPWTRHGGRLGEAGSLVGARVSPTGLKRSELLPVTLLCSG